MGDCGLTGRKIIVDTYGGMARHGGGAFSGKDPSKVDRSAAYAGRYVAKNIVAVGLADRCEVQVSYMIGAACFNSISIDTFGTSTISEDSIVTLIREHFDLRPKGLINMLDLSAPFTKRQLPMGILVESLPPSLGNGLTKLTIASANKPLIVVTRNSNDYSSRFNTIFGLQSR